jgi:hypothetical protein
MLGIQKMPISYNLATINGRLNVVVTNIDAGASFGVMRLLATGNQTVSTIQLLKPSATVTAGILTFNGLPLASPLTLISAQIVAADIEDSTGAVVASGLTVGPSSAFDIVMANPTVSAGQTLTLTLATITGV